MLIEVLVGAILVVLISTAVYYGLDGAGKASGRNKNRSVASFVAQQDQERMRALDANRLTSYIKNPRNATVSVDGVSYAVTSSAALVNDTSTTTGCTGTTGAAGYLKITSTVEDPTNRNGDVKMESLLTPRSSEGGTTVQVVDQNNNPLVGLMVTLVEDTTRNDTTDSSGCVQFGFLKKGEYHVTFSRGAGSYVNREGASLTNQPITAIPGTPTITKLASGPPAALIASVRDQTGVASWVANNTSGTPGGKVQTWGMTIGHPDMTLVNGYRGFAQAAARDTSVAATATLPTTGLTLFPFPSSAGAYTVWAGTCNQTQPTKAADVRSYTPVVSTTTTLSATTQYLKQPRLTVLVRNRTSSSGTYQNMTTAADLVVTDACGKVYPKVTTNTTTGSTANNYRGKAAGGYPFGALTICVDDNLSTTRRRIVNLTDAQRASDGTITTTVDIDSYNNGNSYQGTC